MSEKLGVCPYCKKNNAFDAKFCSYCGKQISAIKETADTKVTDKGSQKAENDAANKLSMIFENTIDIILFIGIIVFSLIKSFTILGAARGVVFGILILYCQRLFDQKRYIALVLAIIIGFLLDIVFKAVLR